MRHGSVLYPPEFVARLPEPNHFEHRPLIELLKGEHRDPAHEIERMERWYTEVQGADESKRRLGRDLRSLRARNFWSALYELASSRAFVERQWPTRYEPALEGVRPDFLVEPPDGSRFIAEVLTVSQSEEDERAEEQTYLVADALARVEHRIGVFVEGVAVPASMPSLRPLVERVRVWLDACDPDRSMTKRFAPPRVPVAVTLTTVKRAEPGPIVEGIMGVGGKIAADETIFSAIARKVRKYRGVRDLGLPFVIFLWVGDWMKVTDTSLEWALFGRDQLQVLRTQQGLRDAEWRRTPGGLFAFGHDGRGEPRNTRLSAVAYCIRDCGSHTRARVLPVGPGQGAVDPASLNTWDLSVESTA
jgi:hypothetical protein